MGPPHPAHPGCGTSVRLSLSTQFRLKLPELVRSGPRLLEELGPRFRAQIHRLPGRARGERSEGIIGGREEVSVAWERVRDTKN